MNKRKRLLWCREAIRANESFDDVVFTDESTVQLDHHSRLCFRKSHRPRVLKQRAKHPVKLHIWGGISKRGATCIVMFSGLMNAERLIRIYEAGLIPFLNERFPGGHRLYQDNDPKHSSVAVEVYFEEKGVNWWATPPESPDLNPIENVWGSLKQYLKNVYKPKILEELKSGIQQFWQTLTPERCTHYINHLRKVIPKVIQEEGGPSGY